jgi:hypothetical protein
MGVGCGYFIKYEFLGLHQIMLIGYWHTPDNVSTRA